MYRCRYDKVTPLSMMSSTTSTSSHQIGVDVLHDANDAARCRVRSVRGDRHQVDLHRKTDGAGQVRHEDEGAFQDADEKGWVVRIVDGNLSAEFGDPTANLVLTDDDRADVVVVVPVAARGAGAASVTQ